MTHVLDAPVVLAPRRRLGLRLPIAPWLYLAPALAVIGVWIYWPLVEAFILSFYQWNMLPTSTPRPVGLANYENLLTLPEMRIAVRNTVLYIAGLLPLSVVLPLAVAIVTQDLAGPLRNLYRSLIFVPMIVAPIVAAVLWRWLLAERNGLVNQALAALGFSDVAFLRDPDVALWTLVWITGWKLIGFSTLLLSAANASISPAYVEAARMDGATRWQIVRDIRLPLLSPTILLLTMMTILFGAQWSFVYINALTGGGPLKSTTNVFYLMWEYGFQSLSAGWSATAGVLTFAAFGLIALVCLTLMKRMAVYDE
ncbi:glycerol-3-phosphate ABC transporter permease [Acuticoccus sediminis]|uniref:Glycerol-3-phosphate ABC transporter permease n=1 Tax=Acuticoccus sediminis TaxID=2184697 RepID=A0A8B2NTW9_9HYPH|nr:sugar ABC transporter permease [Acuticoccus sediminis]RAI01728.1 glycerol-3-phosphate ABC transporter permease [Acuticoccus sediminis]